MKRKSWKKFTGLIFISFLATLARGMTVKTQEGLQAFLPADWYGAILLFVAVGFFAAQAFSDKSDFEISAGPGGITLKKDDDKPQGGGDVPKN